MRVLLVTYWELTHMGGIWTYIRQLADRLISLGVEVDIMGTHSASNEVYIRNLNRSFSKNLVWPMLQAKLNPTNLPQFTADSLLAYYELNRYAFEMAAAHLGIEHYDVIHAQDPVAAVAIKRILKRNIPLVTSYHGALAREAFYDAQTSNPQLTLPAYLQSKRGRYFLSLEQRSAAQSELILVSSHWIKSTLTDIGVPASKFRQIPYAVDLPTYRKAAAARFPHRPPAGKKVIAFTGRLEYIKGVHVLIQALARLKTKRSDWVCWIAGEGTLLEELRDQAAKAGITSDIVFWGKLDNIPSFLKHADIYVQPSLQDTQPFSVTEAQLAGVPVIVSGTAGMPEMVEPERTGWVVPPQNADSLSELLQALLQDQATRKAVGAAAKAWAEQHRSLEEMGLRTLQVYQEAIYRGGLST
ncbi:glycosyltransferase family 4 protein [Paenibacillus barcinonensis]|uniref:Glycosyltransferase family 4 protein n=1 Tax=Paenibacillus barcinonensis TaxID=198119 RepID=A0A2V4WLB0_PAEBA|nr:glycosyltransferase family 4 protein [Paenibacillus barcinonensis]PYE48316.1 glycosyltransferase involved in cell wall biosynthesis [Paenibacillus barcinonensis]QKS56845.1 glycosyltransferase family 4 protein [Paenibacillus barcinonensis]